MTAAHRLPGVLMRRCRGARAVAKFTKTDATRERIAVQFEAATPNDDPAARLGDGILQPAFSAHLATRGCDKEARVAPAIRGANFNAADARSRAALTCRVPTSDAEVISRSSARPAEPFNGRNAQVDAPATAVPVLCSRHTREIDARLQQLPY